MKIKYITLNIWLGGIMMDEALKFIKKEKPHILALQEVYGGTSKDLGRRFRTIDFLRQELEAIGIHHNAFAPSYLDTGNNLNIDVGNVVFSSFPIKNSDSVFYDAPYGKSSSDTSFALIAPRNLQRVEIDCSGKTINVFNTHGIWGHDGLDNPQRIKMGDTIISQVRGAENAILSGDFNCDEDTETIRNIEKHMKNVFKGELKTTFNMTVKKDQKFADAVVDFIFVSPSMKIVEHYAPQVDISDHMPLVVVVEI